MKNYYYPSIISEQQLNNKKIKNREQQLNQEILRSIREDMNSTFASWGVQGRRELRSASALKFGQGQGRVLPAVVEGDRTRDSRRRAAGRGSWGGRRRVGVRTTAGAERQGSQRQWPRMARTATGRGNPWSRQWWRWETEAAVAIGDGGGGSGVRWRRRIEPVDP
jgi:hypothetical protein